MVTSSCGFINEVDSRSKSRGFISFINSGGLVLFQEVTSYNAENLRNLCSTYSLLIISFFIRSKKLKLFSMEFDLLFFYFFQEICGFEPNVNGIIFHQL